MQPAALVYVHGLWMTGAESWLLRRRLAREHGYRIQVFRYASRTASIDSLAAALRASLAAIDAPRVHLVGHSMGGLVILRCLQRYDMPQPGRVVFLGTPAVRSQSAQHIARYGWGRRLVGLAIAQELFTEQQRVWSCQRDLGVIGGFRSVGLAALLVRFGEANDGVVAVSETRLPGAKESVLLKVSHSGMLLSAGVARAVGIFLEHGSFSRKINE